MGLRWDLNLQVDNGRNFLKMRGGWMVILPMPLLAPIKEDRGIKMVMAARAPSSHALEPS